MVRPQSRASDNRGPRDRFQVFAVSRMARTRTGRHHPDLPQRRHGTQRTRTRANHPNHHQTRPPLQAARQAHGLPRSALIIRPPSHAPPTATARRQLSSDNAKVQIMDRPGRVARSPYRATCRCIAGRDGPRPCPGRKHDRRTSSVAGRVRPTRPAAQTSSRSRPTTPRPAKRRPPRRTRRRRSGCG